MQKTLRIIAIQSSIAMALMIPPKCLVSSAATLTTLEPSDFSGEPQITFDALPNQTSLNGRVINGVRFSFGIGTSPGIDAPFQGVGSVEYGFQFSRQRHITSPYVNFAGPLILQFPKKLTQFGYGFAIGTNSDVIPSLTTVELFKGTTSLGSLSFDGRRDGPNIFGSTNGGFAGVASDIPFDRAKIKINALSPYAVDNIRYVSVPFKGL